jgi:hypothetical protein
MQAGTTHLHGFVREQSVLIVATLPFRPAAFGPWKRQTVQPVTAGARHRSPVRLERAEPHNQSLTVAERPGAYSGAMVRFTAIDIQAS